MLKILLLTTLIAVLSVSLTRSLTTKQTEVTAYLSLTAYAGTEAMHICGNNDAYLPVVNTEAKRLLYRGLNEKLVEIDPNSARFPYVFWTNASSTDGTAFFFDDYPNCSELPEASSLWADRSFTYSGQGVMFKENLTTSTFTDENGRSHTSTATTFGLVPTDLATTSHVIMCEREMGPCSFSQRTSDQCPFLSDARLTYVVPGDVTTSATCEQRCREAFFSGRECWGFLYSPSQNECGLIYTENPALLALQQETVSCGADMAADVEYYVKECYIIALNAYTQFPTGSFLARKCTLPGMIEPTTLLSSRPLLSPSTSASRSANMSSRTQAPITRTLPPSTSSLRSANMSSRTLAPLRLSTSPSTSSPRSGNVSSRALAPTSPSTSSPMSDNVSSRALAPTSPPTSSPRSDNVSSRTLAPTSPSTSSPRSDNVSSRALAPTSPSTSFPRSDNVSSRALAPTSPSTSPQRSATVSPPTSALMTPPTSPSTLSAETPAVSSSQSPSIATNTQYSPTIAPLTLVPVSQVNYLRACFCFKQTSKLTRTEVLAEMLSNLTIDVSKTSATIRSKTTAIDNRSSAIAIGVIGITAILVPGALIVFSDFLTLVCKAPTKIAKPKT